MLSELRTRVQKRVGESIESAAVATLNLVALYQEGLQDAFEYLGVNYLKIPVRYNTLYETSAAYAGYGFGLCSDYANRIACKQEQDDMESSAVMAVLYTRTVLAVSLSFTKSAYNLH